jgi:trehalose-phosphatase
MKNVFKNPSEIKGKLAGKNVILFLDFDLTLSPLAKDPTKAFLPLPTKRALRSLMKLMPVIIITGRGLRDIKKRVSVNKMLYVANHGLEYNLGGKNEVFRIPVSARRALLKTKGKLMKNYGKVPGIIFEDKKYSVALGYRKVEQHKIRSLETSFRRMQDVVKKEGVLETRLDKKTFEIRPRVGVNKGTACLFVLKNIRGKYRRKFTPIYIGDSETDEDAFKALKKFGITIRVGRDGKSQAEWYLPNHKEVTYFLRLLTVWDDVGTSVNRLSQF